MDSKRYKVNINGHNWYFVKMGKGKPLLIIHGMLGFADFFLPIAEHLKNDFEMIIPDLPGNGFTKALLNGNKIEDLAEGVANFIKALGYENLNVYGFSMGGTVAFSLCQKYPKLIDNLVIMSSPWKKKSLKLSFIEKYLVYGQLYYLPKFILQGVTKLLNKRVIKIYTALFSEQSLKEHFDEYSDSIAKAFTLIDPIACIETFKSLDLFEYPKSILLMEGLLLLLQS